MKKEHSILFTLLFICGTASVYSQTNTFPSSGNAGVGTTSPGTALMVINSSPVISLFDLESNPLDGTSLGRLAFGSTSGEFASIGSMRVGTSYDDLTSLVFKTSWAAGAGGDGTNLERMRVDHRGFLGIGTSSPFLKLTISGSSSGLSGNAYVNTAAIQDQTNYRGIYLGYDSSAQIGVVSSASYGTASQLAFWGYNGSGWAEHMRIASNGNVGIGTTDPDSKLTVAGKVHARSVKIEVSAGADFVFNKNYKLPSLKEIEEFVNTKGHLPGIAPALEMEKNGVELGELNIKLLQKIEELTLYLIDLKKENTKMQEDIAALKKARVKNK